MCTGKCSRCIAISLYPLAVLSIICNILLFFPSWSNKYVKEAHITPEVTYLGGIIGGGIMVLIPALSIHLTEEGRCCGNRAGMFLSIFVAAVGVLGALYSFTVAILGLANGPLCKADGGKWMRPFENSNSTYLTHYSSWAACTEPKGVVRFNIGLFFTLVIASSLQVALLTIQMINGLVGCLCGICGKKEET